MSGRRLGLPVRKVEAYQWINDNGPYILIPVGPRRQLVKFLIDTGAQISKLGVRSRQQKVRITGANGGTDLCQTAKVSLWLPGEKRMSSNRFAIKVHYENILGFDILNGRTWCLPDGSVWSFGSNTDLNPCRNQEAAVRVLRAAPVLPESKITNVPQYPISAAAREGISEVIADLEKRQIISRTHSPYNSPVWPVRKPDGRWRLTVDYRRLNANTARLTAAVPNIATLTATLQAAAHPWMAALDVKDMFFMVPLREEDKEKFAFTWEGIQYTFNRLPQGYKHSPTIAHAALAELLQSVSLPQDVKLYQYIDDILIGGTSPETVGEAAAAVWQTLNKAEIEVPPGKCQGPSKEVKFLGTCWIAGSAVIPPDTLRKIEELQMPQSKKELQQLMGTLGYWRKHVPGFSIISRPLYSLLRKGKSWEWRSDHSEAIKTLIGELKTYQSLGPVHPHNPIIAEWGFPEHATHCNLFQAGPDGTKRPLLFSSTAFKETEQRYSEWEKGLLSLV
uniref:ribonuclease H n=1 Tax=Calidris pygmaea TaxID=425635 RepID=A0A8C3K9U4_9CHAR